MKIYSRRHSKHPSSFWWFTDYGNGDFTMEMWIPVSKKLQAIGIDPKFLDFNECGFSIDDFERELAELQEDLPEDE